MPIWIRFVVFACAFMLIPTYVTKNGPPIIELDRTTIGTIAIFCAPPFVVIGLIRITRGTLFTKTD